MALEPQRQRHALTPAASEARSECSERSGSDFRCGFRRATTKPTPKIARHLVAP